MMIKLGHKKINNEIKRAIKLSPMDARVCVMQTVSRYVYNKNDEKELEVVDVAFHYFTNYKAAKKFAAEEWMDTEKGYSISVSIPWLLVNDIKGYRVELGSFITTNYLIPLK